MRLVIVRHGETTENLEGITMGQTGGHLTGRGRKQIKMAAQALKDEKIDAAYTSDMARTKETAEEIMKYHPDVELVYEKSLRERDFGTLTGTKKASEIERKMTYEEFMDFKPDDGESGKEMRKRTIDFYEKILREHINDIVLFVTHAGNLIELLFHILGWGKEKYEEMKPGNTAITILEIDKEGNYKIEKLNSMEHLKDLPHLSP